MSRPNSPFISAVALTGLWILAGFPTTAQPPVPRVLTFMESIKGNEEIELRSPVAVAASSAEELAVADVFGARLLRFRRVGATWQLEKSIELPGAPVDLTHDGRRWIVSLRQGKGLVALEGSELQQRSVPLPPEAVPGAITVFPNGDLLVYDHAGHSVLRLTGDGDLRSRTPVEADITALAATAAGGFLAAAAVEGSVLSFDANGVLSATWKLPSTGEIPAWPVGLAVEPGGDIVVVDRHKGRLLVLDATGRVVGFGSGKGWEPGLLLFPAGLARLPNGHFLVADQGNGRAQIFRRIE